MRLLNMKPLLDPAGITLKIIEWIRLGINMKFKLFIITIFSALSFNVYSKCISTNEEDVIVNSYQNGINQIITLNQDKLKNIFKLKYEPNFENRVLKSILNNRKNYCSFDYIAYDVNNKVFGVLIFSYNDSKILNKDYNSLLNLKFFPDKKVITTFKVAKKESRIYVYFGNYMYLYSPNKTIDAIY